MCQCPQYEADSAPALALKATIDRTEKRFANYAKAGLLCGADGLPHLISDPGLALKYGHAGEVFVSGSRTGVQGPARCRVGSQGVGGACGLHTSRGAGPDGGLAAPAVHDPCSHLPPPPRL